MEYKTIISLSALLLISLVLAFGIDWIVKRIQKYFDDKELERNKNYFNNDRFFKMFSNDYIFIKEERLKICHRKYNHKTASNSRKIRGAGK